MTQRNRLLMRGLALTDTAVIVAAGALMVSVLLPAAAKTRDAARRAMCADNMHHLMVGVLSYADDHAGKGPMRGWMPYTVAETPHEAWGTGGNNTKVLTNLGQLYPYWIGGDHNRLYCPSRYKYRDNPNHGWKSMYLYPCDTVFTFGGYDYGHILTPRSGPLQSPDFNAPNPYPQETWLSRFAGWVEDWELEHGTSFQMPDTPAIITDWYIGMPDIPIHGRGLNVAYSDGHVSCLDIGGIPGGRQAMYDVWYKVSVKQ